MAPGFSAEGLRGNYYSVENADATAPVAFLLYRIRRSLFSLDNLKEKSGDGAAIREGGGGRSTMDTIRIYGKRQRRSHLAGAGTNDVKRCGQRTAPARRQRAASRSADPWCRGVGGVDALATIASLVANRLLFLMEFSCD
jgi:hypothetical protein